MNISKQNLVMLTIFSVFVILGCENEKEMLIPELGVGEKVLSFDENKVQTLEITSNGHWSVRAIRDTTDFIISPREGYGNGLVTITLDRTKVENINGYLKVTYLDGTNDGLEVAQGVKMVASALENIDVSPKLLELSKNTHFTQASVQINIAGKWIAELSDTTWCYIDKKSGEGEGTIQVSLKEKINSKNKETELLIALAEWPNAKIPITIVQKETFIAEEYVILNKASIGNGIDIVFIGDGFTEDDFTKGGKWQQALDTVNTYLFEVEPFKSYRDYFNVYAVAAPFEGSLYDEGIDTTSMAIYDPSKELNLSIQMKSDVISSYAFRKTPVSKDKENFSQMLICLLINADKSNYNGWCLQNYIKPSSTWCMAIVPCSVFADCCHRNIFTHDLYGHGFGGFLDEYFSGDDTYPETNVPDQISSWEEYDYGRNVCYSNSDLEKIPDAWYKLAQMNEYKDYVQFWEGSLAFAHGVWRSTNYSVMNAFGIENNNVAMQYYRYYNPVQREILLYRIYKLAGRGDEYSLQTFLDYDVINRDMDEYYRNLLE